MAIGLVESVNAEKRTINVVVNDAGGTRHLPEVKLLKHHEIPEIEDVVLVIRDGGEYYYIGIPEEETEAAIEERAELHNVGGDQSMGDSENGPGIGVRKGGMVVMLADRVTGFIASKIKGMIQILGKTINLDTDFFHFRARTETDKVNTTIDARLAGSPRGIPISIEMLKSIIDTHDGRITMDLSGFNDVDLHLKFAPQAAQYKGSTVTIENDTPMGPVKIGWNGSTGTVNVESPTQIKVDAQAVLVNSEGNPLDRVLTAKDQCWYTGNIIGQGCPRLFVGV